MHISAKGRELALESTTSPIRPLEQQYQFLAHFSVLSVAVIVVIICRLLC